MPMLLLNEIFGEPLFSHDTLSRSHHPVSQYKKPIFNLTTDMDLIETDKHYHIKLDVPGIPKENIQVQVEKDTLVIQGERKDEYNTNSTCEDGFIKRHYSQRSFGRFSRRIQLPENCNLDQVEATVNNGVLSMVFDKKALNDVTRRIQIN